MITKSDVDAAVARIAGHVRSTPVLTVEAGQFGPEVLLKCEYVQHTGSFKARGAFNRILAAAERAGHGHREGQAERAGWGRESECATERAGRDRETVTEQAGYGRHEDLTKQAGHGRESECATERAGRDRGGVTERAGRGGEAGARGREGAAGAGARGREREDEWAERGRGGTERDRGGEGAGVRVDGRGLAEAGVVAASGGNAGLAVAYAAARLRVPAAVYVPVSAPAVKVDKLRALGAEVCQIGTEFAQANEAALARASETGALFCHAYDQPEIVAGQGSLAVELLDQAPDVDTVLVSVGGGGLAGGIAAGLDGRAKLVAVEPQTIPTLHTALAKGAPVDVAVSGVAADSLGARRVGEIAFELAVRHNVHSVFVDDASIIAARRLLWDRLRIVVEHGTAAALAALTTGAYRPAPGERVAVVLCGANTDPADLAG